MTRATNRPSRFITRYSVLTFFLLTLLLGGGTVLLVVQGVLPTELTMASALSASAAGLIMTALEDGRAGLKLMLERLLTWRVKPGYWLFAVFFLVPAFLLGSLANPLFSGDPLTFKEMAPLTNILPMFVGIFIVAGLGQELGWTGFLMPRLQARFSALTACVIRALFGGIWHLPLFIYSWLQHPAVADIHYSGWIAQKNFVVAFLSTLLLFQLPWSIFFTWIFNNTRGSILLVAVLHGSEAWVATCMMSAGIDPRNLDNYWGYGVVMVMVAVLLLITNGPQDLSRRHKRIVHQTTLD